jgi:uncharacterized membrane protein SpoIIM required for sporulation
VAIDQFIQQNEPSWTRLEYLAREARRRKPQLSPAELDEFVRLYQQTSTHLSHARTNLQDPGLSMRLTRVVADANGALYGRSGNAVRGLTDFFRYSFPASVWTARWFIVAALLLTFIPALIFGTWLGVSDRAVESIGDAAAREAYITEDFESYYSSAPAAQFSTEVLVNNIQVSFLAFAFGIVFCLGTAYILIFNGINVGVAAGLFYNVGEPGKFWGLILPHGLIELTAVVVAGAAGLRLGWALISPGDKTRAAALVDEGRRSVVVVLGLMVVFIVAGLIEGFVTPSPLSTAVRISIGVLAELVFILYIVTRGRVAESHGLTGQWGEHIPRTPTR